MTPNSPTTCTNTINVFGKTFKNYDALAPADLLAQRAFEQSCNTAMISNHSKSCRTTG